MCWEWIECHIFLDNSKKYEDQARADTLRNAWLKNLTTADKELLESSMVAELESGTANQQSANSVQSDV